MEKAYNLVNSNTGRNVINQLVIKGENKVTFQSYDSTIAILDEAKNTLTIGKNWDYSNTTRKWFYEFLRQYARINAKKPDVLRMIAAGGVQGYMAFDVVYDSNMA